MHQSHDINNTSSSSSSGDSNNTRATIKAEIKEQIKKEEYQYKASTIATEINLWLQYTGWEEVLAGSKYDLVKTAAFTATVSATEPELACIIQSWEQIIQQSLAMLMAISNYKDILKWQALPKNKVASQQPFERPKKRTITCYSQTFAWLLCYIMYTAPKSINNETKTKIGIMFSLLQLVHIKDIQEAVVVAVAMTDNNNNKLNIVVLGLMISLLIQDTS